MLKHIRQSLITRLIIYFLLAGVLFTVLFGINFAHSLRVHFKQEILPNIAQYLNYIAQDIGTPPDLLKAQRLSDSLSFDLGIQGPGLDWYSNESMPAVDQLDFEAGPAPYQDYRIAHRRGTNVVILRVADYDYMFVIGRLLKGPRHQRSIGFILFILVSLALLFFLIRSSLKPLKGISHGIQDIAQGELERPIKTQGSMEFKNLAAGINEMALQIKSMLESKQQLLLAISHELRSPLTRAKVNLELLSDPSIKQALVDDVNEMQELVSQILESERLNQKHAVLNKKDFALNELVKNTVSQYFPHNAITIEADNVVIRADQTRLALLIKNLLDNALKYSLESDAQPPVVRVYQDQSAVIFEVEDYGCGMSKENLEQITQAFYRIDQARQRSTGGVGLGLYLCQLIVTAHQGDMAFKSHINQGTKVKIVLPSGKPDNP